MMEQLNTDAAKSFVWVRTQMNSPAQRPWFTDSGGVQRAPARMGERPGGGQPAQDRGPSLALEGTTPYLERIAGIRQQGGRLADHEFADRQAYLFDQSGPRRPAAGHQHHPLAPSADLQSGAIFCARAHSTAPMPAAPSLSDKAATPMWRAEPLRMRPRRHHHHSQRHPGNDHGNDRHRAVIWTTCWSCSR